MESRSNYEVLRTEIDHMKDDIKEIKEESKENNKYFREVIDTLKENSIQQTAILKNQERRFEEVNKDITALKVDLDTTIQSNTKWYQDFLSDNFGKFLKIILIIILILSGVKLAGVDVGKLITGI